MARPKKTPGESTVSVAGKAAAKGRKKAAEAPRQIEPYEHQADRPNNPPVGLVNARADREAPKKTYTFDPHLDPALHWAGKAEKPSVSVDTVSLHVHERVDPRSILESVRRRAPEGQLEALQPSLFEQPRYQLPLREAIEFYKHRQGWSNRLIAGDSLMVMNSLLEKEGMRGQVQMVYLDPPYGITYKSNFQPFVNQREVVDGKDDDLNQEPEMLRAFRDTWELGIHSYLTYLRDRLKLAKELLNESGSIFVQISDRNLHLVRSLMDEVFGADNYIVSIPFKKKGSQKSGLLNPVNDYIVWYGASPRESGKIKFRPLFAKRTLDSDALSEFKNLELPSGEELAIKDIKGPKGEKGYYLDNPDALKTDFPGCRIFRANPMVSGGWRANQSPAYKYQGRSYSPGADKCFKATSRNPEGGPCGMDRLAWAGRLIANPESLRFKSYYDDFGYYPLTNWWDGLGGASKPIYVVQTNPEVIQRCMLMVTDPGDLVLDPTCGSGTTAMVAEEWGRRWITCDSSRVALALARQRLTTATFDYYQLAQPQEGVDAGFVYKRVPHVMLSDIANCAGIKPGLDKDVLRKLIDKAATMEPLFDAPEKEKGKVRVTGPFTVEAVPAPLVKSPDELMADGAPTTPGADEALAREGETYRQARWREDLLAAGIRGKKGGRVRLTELRPLGGFRYLHADGWANLQVKTPTAKGSRLDQEFDLVFGASAGSKDKAAETTDALEGPVRVLVSFGPEHAPLEQRQVELALHEANKIRDAYAPKPLLLVFAAFQFDPEAAKDIDALDVSLQGYPVWKVQMNTDLLSEDLKKKSASSDAFWLLGKPQVDLFKNPDGTFQVQVQGFDYFDTKKGELTSGEKDQVAMWMLDPDYDGRSLIPRQMFFPLAKAKDGWTKVAKDLKAEIDPELIEAFKGDTSLPFNSGPNRKAAVKIVDDRGLESLCILELP